MAERRASPKPNGSQPELPVPQDTDRSPDTFAVTKVRAHGPLLYSSVRALRDFREYGFIFPNVFHKEREKYQDGSHIVEHALVWSLSGEGSVPFLAARNSRPKIMPVMLEIDDAWQPPDANMPRVIKVSGTREDEVSVVVSGGFVPFDAVRLIMVNDGNVAVEAGTVFNIGTGHTAIPEIRVVPGLFASNPDEFVPIRKHLENICVTEVNRHVSDSADRLLGAICHASYALAGRHREVAVMFSDLVSTALGIAERHSSTVSAIGTEVAIALGGSNLPLHMDHDARIAAVATKLLSQVAPPSNFVRDTFVKDLQDELHSLDTSQAVERSPHVASLDGIMAVLRNEADWDVTISQISDPSLLAIAYLVRGSGKLAELRDATVSSQISPEASLMALALSGTLNRLTGTHVDDRPHALMKSIICVVARAVTSAITGVETPKVAIELRSSATGPATQQWMLLIDQVVAHEWSGPMRDDEGTGTEDDENILVDTDITAILPAGTGEQRTVGDLIAASTEATEVGSPDQVAERSLTRARIEIATHRAYSVVDEAVHQLIKCAVKRQETWARMREAEYLHPTDREVKDFKRLRDEADRELEAQMRRLLDEYAERDRLKKEWLEVSRDAKQQ